MSSSGHGSGWKVPSTSAPAVCAPRPACGPACCRSPSHGPRGKSRPQPNGRDRRRHWHRSCSAPYPALPLHAVHRCRWLATLRRSRHGRATPTGARSRTRPAWHLVPADAEPRRSRRDRRGICRARPAGHLVVRKSPSLSTTRPDQYIRTWLFSIRCLGPVSNREPVSSSYRGTTTRPKLASLSAWGDSLPRLPHV